MRYFICFFLCFINYSVQAGGLSKSLKELGVLGNIDRPAIVNDQLGGFMTGGGVHARHPAKDVNLFNVQMPSLEMGCGGIDLFSGGFGYIHLDQIKKLFTDIGAKAASYGTMLAIKTISPQIADLLSQLEAMARTINAQNINSCQMGASIAAGLWPKTAASQDMACQARRMGDNKAGQFFTARYNCSNENKAQTNKDEYQGLLGTEFNLVWNTLKKTNIMLKDEEVEELMSISGTLISKPDSNGKDHVSFMHKNSLLKDAKLLEGLIYGGDDQKVKRYKCTDKGNAKCIELKIVDETISKEDSYIFKIKKHLSNISDKFIAENHGSETKLLPEEQELIQTSSIPILKIISIESVLKGNKESVSISVEEYAELIAFDYLINYLDKMLDEVYGALSVLEYSQMDGEHIKNFKEEIRYIKGFLFNERQSAFAKMETILSVKHRMMQVEAMVKSAFAEYRVN